MVAALDIDMEEVAEVEHRLGRNSKKPVCPHAPKRPITGFLLWSNENRDRLMGDHPNLPVSEIGKKLGEEWGKLSDDVKTKFQAKFLKEKKSYDTKMEKYKKTSHYKKHQTALLAWKIHETKKPFQRDENHPKRNLTGYMLFMASVREKVIKENPEYTAPEIMKEQSTWWKALTDDERKPWNDKAAKAKAAYEKKLESYMRTKSYKKYKEAKDKYKADMLKKRNKLLGIKPKKKRARSLSSKPRRASRKAKKAKNAKSRSKSGKRRGSARRTAKRRSTSRRKAPTKRRGRAATKKRGRKAKSPSSSDVTETSRSRTPSSRSRSRSASAPKSKKRSKKKR